MNLSKSFDGRINLPDFPAIFLSYFLPAKHGVRSLTGGFLSRRKRDLSLDLSLRSSLSMHRRAVCPRRSRTSRCDGTWLSVFQRLWWKLWRSRAHWYLWLKFESRCYASWNLLYNVCLNIHYTYTRTICTCISFAYNVFLNLTVYERDKREYIKEKSFYNVDLTTMRNDFMPVNICSLVYQVDDNKYDNVKRAHFYGYLPNKASLLQFCRFVRLTLN